MPPKSRSVILSAKWFWKNDSEDWVEYKPEQTQILEKALKEGKESVGSTI